MKSGLYLDLLFDLKNSKNDYSNCLKTNVLNAINVKNVNQISPRTDKQPLFLTLFQHKKRTDIKNGGKVN